MDFGALDEHAQREVIALLQSDVSARQRLMPEKIEALARGLDDADWRIVEQNGAAVLRSYGMDRYVRLLEKTYEAVRNVPVRQHIDRKILLEAFLDARRFRMLEQR